MSSSSFSPVARGFVYNTGKVQEAYQMDLYKLDHDQKLENAFPKLVNINPSAEYVEIDQAAGTFTAYTLKQQYYSINSRSAVTLTAANKLTYFHVIRGAAGAGGNFIPTTEKAAPNGVASLNANGVVPTAQLEIVAFENAYGLVRTVDNNTNTTAVATHDLLAAMTTPLATDTIYVTDQTVNANKKLTMQNLATYVQNNLSTLTKIPGGSIAGGANASGPTVVAPQAATVTDGSYHTVQTPGFFTVNGGAPIKLDLGDKLVWNKTDNEYIIIPAGDNQAAIDVPITPIPASTSNYAINGPDLQAAILELATQIKTKAYHHINQLWEYDSFKVGVYPSFGFNGLPYNDRGTMIVRHDRDAKAIYNTEVTMKIIGAISADCKLTIDEIDLAGNLVQTCVTILIPANSSSQVITDTTQWNATIGNFLQFTTDCQDQNVGAELVIGYQEKM